MLSELDLTQKHSLVTNKSQGEDTVRFSQSVNLDAPT